MALIKINFIKSSSVYYACKKTFLYPLCWMCIHSLIQIQQQHLYNGAQWCWRQRRLAIANTVLKIKWSFVHCSTIIIILRPYLHVYIYMEPYRELSAESEVHAADSLSSRFSCSDVKNLIKLTLSTRALVAIN